MKKYVNKWKTLSVKVEQWEDNKKYPENSIVKHLLDNRNIVENVAGSYRYYIDRNGKNSANCLMIEGNYLVKYHNNKYTYYTKEIFENMFAEVVQHCRIIAKLRLRFLQQKMNALLSIYKLNSYINLV